MKKLVLLLAVAFSVSMFSCGGGQEGENKDSAANKAADQNTEAAAPAAAEEVAPVEGEAAPVEGEAAPAADAEAPAADAAAPAAE